MEKTTRALLSRQLDIAWALTGYHLNNLTNEECLWRPAQKGLHVWKQADGAWKADWPEHEGYDLGPPSIAWITWHIGFWWSMVLNHSFGDASLTREEVQWPGSAEKAIKWIEGLHDEWREQIGKLTDADLNASTLTKWPMQDVPFADIVGWVNIELTKNASEIGYARFLHGVKTA